jgi:O-antigen ligase
LAALGITLAAGVFRPLGDLLFGGDGLESRMYAALLLASMLLVAVVAMMQRRWPHFLRAEVLLFGAWLAWALMTGDFSSETGYKDVDGVYRNAALAGMTLLSTAMLTAEAGSFRYVAVGCVGAGLVLLGTSMVVESVAYVGSKAEYRLGSDLGNANEWGYAFLLALIGSLVLSADRSLRWFWRVVALFVACALLVGIVVTGSRKAFLGAIAMAVFVYTLFRNRRGLAVRSIVVMFAGLALLYGVFNVVLESTFLGERLRETRSLDQLATVEHERLGNYYQLVSAMTEQPFTGVGLGHWQRISWTGKTSHSEYVSVLGETGLVGGILYFGLYAVLVRRLTIAFIKRESGGDIRNSTVPLLLAALVVLLLLAFGRWNFTNSFHYAVVGGMAGIGWVSARRRKAIRN